MEFPRSRRKMGNIRRETNRMNELDPLESTTTTTEFSIVRRWNDQVLRLNELRQEWRADENGGE